MDNRKLLAMVMGIATLTLIACTSMASKPLPFIPGVDATSVWLFEKKDGSGMILNGNVSRKIDSITIQNYLQTEYGYNIVANRITVE